MSLAAVFANALPRDAVVSDPEVIARRYGRNVTALTRRIPLVLRPATEDEVSGIVALANEHLIPLYPFSTGKNWGLGSKLPVIDGCALVDLSRMNRIVEVSDAFGYAIIEPGVTQADLAAHLEARFPALTFNLTGSYAHTSVVGNVLERGDGASARVHDLLGVRGILGNGQPFEAGGVWDYVGGPHPSHCSRYVAGPDLAGMFAQSNFGIVTQMAFRLIHKPARRYIVWGASRSADLEKLVDTFDRFGRAGVINRGSINIGYENRFLQAKRTLGAMDGPEARPDRDGEAAWNFYALVAGTERTADAVADELGEALAPICIALEAKCIERIVDPSTDLPAFLQPVAKPLMGSPDAESIKIIYALTGTPLPSDAREVDVDETPFGMKSFIPIVPHRGTYARQASGIVSAAANRFDLNVKLSFFGDGRTLITIHFRSDDPEQVVRAERCERALWDEMVAAGFPPYRVGIDQMERLVGLHPGRFALVAQLKSALDPNDIIAPGRYGRSRRMERPGGVPAP